MTIHFTFTGVYAGVPFCGIQRNESDQFTHVPYSSGGLARVLADPELCPACLDLWRDLDDEEEEA